MYKEILNRLDNLDAQGVEVAALDAGPTLGESVGEFLSLPALRGFWPFSSVDETAAVYDISGQARKLTAAGTPTFGVLPAGVPYTILNGSTQYFTRAHEAGLNITGALTFGGWFYHNNAPGTAETLIAKRQTTAHYQLRRDDDGRVTVRISDDGTTSGAHWPGATSVAVTAAGAWYFAAGRFTPSTELALFLNGVKAVNTTSIPAAIYSGGSDGLFVGALTGPTLLLAGRGAFAFVCAAALTDEHVRRLYRHTRGLFGV